MKLNKEVVKKKEGEKMLKNLVNRIVGVKKGWKMGEYREKDVEEIRKKVGRGKVI